MITYIERDTDKIQLNRNSNRKMVKYSLLLNTYYHDQVSKLNESLDENVLTIIYQRNYIQIPI